MRSIHRFDQLVFYSIVDCYQPLMMCSPQRWLSGQSVRPVSGRSWVRSPTASYLRRYKNGTRCFLAQRSAYKDRSGFSLLSNLVQKKEMDTIWNERSRVINISCRLTSGPYFSYFSYFSLLFDPEPYFPLLFKKPALLSLLFGVSCC